jgi:transposase
MDIHSDSHRVSRLEVVDTGRRRRWTEAEKLRIVEESFSRPRHASTTARRYGLSGGLLFAWRKAYREGRLGGVPVDGFVPAVIVPESVAAAPWPGDAGGGRPAFAKPASAGEGRMEVVSASGRRVVIGPDFDPRALRLLLAVLEQAPVHRSPECEGG